MKESWIYKYGENTIEVRNDFAAEMYVNGQLQDKKTGISMSASLTGRLDSGEEIKASLGGILSVKCNLFINNVLQEPVETKK